MYKNKLHKAILREQLHGAISSSFPSSLPCMFNDGRNKNVSNKCTIFTDLIIMSFKCEYCGAHSAETKSSGEIKENASIITLNV